MSDGGSSAILSIPFSIATEQIGIWGLHRESRVLSIPRSTFPWMPPHPHDVLLPFSSACIISFAMTAGPVGASDDVLANLTSWMVRP